MIDPEQGARRFRAAPHRAQLTRAIPAMRSRRCPMLVVMPFADRASCVVRRSPIGRFVLTERPGDRDIAHRTRLPTAPKFARRADSAAGFALGDAAHIRIFKREQLELAQRARRGATRCSATMTSANSRGELGPKLKEGDRQAPEGFYRVAQSQLNPNSRHHLSFNLGFPNAFDRAAWPHRLGADGAWRLLLDRLLRHHRP